MCRVIQIRKILSWCTRCSRQRRPRKMASRGWCNSLASFTISENFWLSKAANLNGPSLVTRFPSVAGLMNASCIITTLRSRRIQIYIIPFTLLSMVFISLTVACPRCTWAGDTMSTCTRYVDRICLKRHFTLSGITRSMLHIKKARIRIFWMSTIIRWCRS